LDFVEFLKHKKYFEIKKDETEIKKDPVFGFVKCKYGMSPDFDEPLEECKNYM
jgi:hypothetical protein